MKFCIYYAIELHWLNLFHIFDGIQPKSKIMKRTLKIGFLLTFVLSLNYAYSQLEYSAFTSTGSGYSVTAVTDYQCLGINPANLGWKRNAHNWNLGLAGMGLLVYSEPLTKHQVTHDLFGRDATKFTEITTPGNIPADRTEAIDNFTDTRLLGHATYELFGISFQKKKFGGIAFAIRTKIHWDSKLNNKAARFLFLGYYDDTYFEIEQDEEGKYGKAIDPKTTSVLYNPSNLEHIWYNEYVLGYGRELVDNENFNFYAGVDFKIVQGYGMVYVDIPDASTAIGYQALCPLYGVDYGDNETPSQMEGEGLKTAGLGFGVDLGVSFLIQKKLRLALAVNDIGSIKWDGNVYEGENPNVYEIRSAGISSYNIFGEAGDIISDNTNVGEWKGLNEKKVGLPTNLRGGASFRFDEHWELGTDLYVPFKTDVPGGYKKAVFGFGTRYDPSPWVQLSTGFVTGGYFGWNIPLGVTFRPVNNDNATWEIGFATRDILTVFKKSDKEGTDPMISMCFGFLRFSFGYHEEEKRFLDE